MMLTNSPTISRLEKTKPMQRLKFLLITLIFPIITAYAVWIPQKPIPERLVADYANMLTKSEQQSLEEKLVQFDNSTTTEMVVVTVDDLHGEAIALVATETGQQWGVGQKGFDNGIVMLIKEKTAGSKGQVFIATGYGLEGIIPDATAKRIVENEILPHFRNNDIYGGITAGINTLQQISLGEFSAKDYNERSARESGSPLGWLVPLIMFIFIFGGGFGRARRVRRGSIGRSLPFWVLLSMLGSGSRHRGSYGNFTSGRGGFGGGGFGGFGGGSFGGGGAGGSW